MHSTAEKFLHAAHTALGVPDADSDAVLNIFRSYLDRFPKRPANIRLACIAVAVLPFAVVLQEMCLRLNFSNDEVEQFFSGIIIHNAPPEEIGHCLNILRSRRIAVFVNVYTMFIRIAEHVELFQMLEINDANSPLII